MQILRFCFHCPADYSELLPGDLEMGALFIEDLISLTLKELPRVMIVEPVKLSFSPVRNMFSFQVRVRCYDCCEVPSDETEDIELQVECLICHALLQMFWFVSVSNLGC